MLESVGGLQTQYAPSGYIGLWSRMRGFERAQLTEALESRRVIQGTLMRATIHMVSAADYWPMEVGVRAARREWWLRAARSQYAGLDPEEVGRAVADELASGPLRQKELSRRLNERGSGGPQAGINILADIVRVPPSGTWDQRRADLYGLAADWLKPPENLTERDGIELLIRRYLGGFGPAAAGGRRQLDGRQHRYRRRRWRRPWSCAPSAMRAAEPWSICRMRRCPIPTRRRPRASCPSGTRPCWSMPDGP